MHSKNRYKGSLSSETVRSDSPSSFENAAGCTALFGLNSLDPNTFFSLIKFRPK